MSSKPGPDFICIGAQKAGTSWLHANLQQHSEFWLPPFKELCYFNRGRMNLVRTLTAKGHPFVRARKRLASVVAKKIRGAKQTNLAWLARFTFFPRNDGWYLSLFRDGADKISGEVSPNYAPMNEEQIAHVRQLCPDTKIIYILRDPIDRSWSGANMFIDLMKNADELSPEERSKMPFSTHNAGNTSYVANLARWKRHFPQDQLLVTFFDDLVADPAEFLARILGFLGSHFDPQDLPASIDQPRNVGNKRPIPQDIERALASRYCDEIRTLAEQFPNSPAQAWLRRAEGLLKIS